MLANKLLERWKQEEQTPFSGWNFSHIREKYYEEYPPWDYISIVKKHITAAHSVLDLATGGGEVFSKILSSYRPRKVVAAEGYKPNVAVARNRLKKLKAPVMYANETKKLPFKDGEFDLVLNRHGGLNVTEIARILCRNGLFITQQVDGRNLRDLQREFGATQKWKSNTLSTIRRKLKSAGFEIIRAQEWRGETIFKDVGALVYFLKAIAWIVDDFSVDTYAPVLLKLHKKIEKKGMLCFSSRRFLILARKK